MLYGTTVAFLERLGLDSLDDLPPLGDFVPDASVVEALERGLRVDVASTILADAPGDASTPTPAIRRRRPTLASDVADAAQPERREPSGCRRCSRAPGSARGARARS